MSLFVLSFVSHRRVKTGCFFSYSVKSDNYVTRNKQIGIVNLYTMSLIFRSSCFWSKEISCSMTSSSNGDTYLFVSAAHLEQASHI